MHYKKIFCVFGLVFLLTLNSYAQSKVEYMNELSQARKNFILERDKLHDQDRMLRLNWHKEREALYEKLKENPSDQSIKDKLNEGAKKFLADKKEIYRKLEELRKNWLRQRKELGNKIRTANS